MKKSGVHKIAVIIPKYGLLGGAEGYAAEVTERISQNDAFEIHVLANRWSGSSERITFHKIPIVTFPKFLITPSFAYFVSKELAKMHCDLVHTHDRIFCADVFTMHGIPHRIWIKDVRKKKWMSLFDRATARVERHLIEKGGCHKFLPVSSLTRQKLMDEYGGIDPGKIEIVPPGINTAQFNPAGDDVRSREKAAFGIAPDEFTILFVSMNFDIKGLDVLLAGLGQLKAKDPGRKWKLLIVGKGDTSSYMQKAVRLGIGDHLVFTGAVQREKLPDVYSAGDIFAMPSKFDTFGMTVLEAMAVGLPVIISGTVGAQDIVTEGINGFVVRGSGMDRAIADKIEALMNDSRRAGMARAAVATAAKYSWEEIAKKMEVVYKEVLNSKGMQ